MTDRPTKAHEYLFLMSKSEAYYYDIDSTREAFTMKPQRRPHGRPVDATPRAGQPKQAWSTAAREEVGVDGHPLGRNKRSVWTVATRPYNEAHFAVFPPDLITPCILAGSRPGDVVLDPFFGSGTTGKVAEDNGRLWLGFDLNPAYAELQKKRTAQRGLCFAVGSKEG